jgi:uncharacterized membrane protein
MRQLTRLILWWLTVSPLVFAADYRFVKIDVPNSISTEALGINAREDIVGRYTDAEDIDHGFLLRKGVFTSIDVPNAEATFGARAINARGDIVGNFLGSDSVVHGFLLKDGQFTQIDYPGASVATFVNGINNAGDLTGSHIDALGESGFILKDGVFKDVHVPGSFSSSVRFAQDSGRVLVGQAEMPPDGAFHGFLRNKPGHIQLLVFPGSSFPCTGARWINQRGEIVGFFSLVDSLDDCTAAEQSHGFLLRDGQYTQIDVPRSINSKLFAINDDGVIVGNFTDKNGNTHGFKAVPK